MSDLANAVDECGHRSFCLILPTLKLIKGREQRLHS